MTCVACGSAGVEPLTHVAEVLSGCRTAVSLVSSLRGAGVWATLRYEGWVMFHIR